MNTSNKNPSPSPRSKASPCPPSEVSLDAGGSERLGVVAIGRNEGQRLRLCLESVVGRVAQVVYVDSGSTDGSAELARSLGVEVVDLDLSVPFTAARARNEGLARLQEVAAGSIPGAAPGIAYVQMIDGDCEVVDGWFEAAVDALEANPKHAVVCGRRRERYPDQTIYNLSLIHI